MTHLNRKTAPNPAKNYVTEVSRAASFELVLVVHASSTEESSTAENVADAGLNRATRKQHKNDSTRQSSLSLSIPLRRRSPRGAASSREVAQKVEQLVVGKARSGRRLGSERVLEASTCPPRMLILSCGLFESDAFHMYFIVGRRPGAANPCARQP
jgi:chaperonin GroEL (HSP60 family)